MSRVLYSVVVGALLVLAACNQNYVDISMVSAKLDESAAKSMAAYRAATTDYQRIAARDRIVAIREKQVVMASRIAVSTMPEVQAHTMTLEEGQKKRAELMAEAEKKLNEAKLLPFGPAAGSTPASTGAPAAAPGAAPAAAPAPVAPPAPAAPPSGSKPGFSAPGTSTHARWNSVPQRRA